MIFMTNEKFYKKTLLVKIKNSLDKLKGIKYFHIKDYVFDEYNDIQVLINSFYKYDSQGEKIKSIGENGFFKDEEYNAVLETYMNKYLDYEKEYYISYENIHYLTFIFSEFLTFIESWRNVYHTYDLTLFNKNEVFVINSNEYDFTVHYTKL